MTAGGTTTSFDPTGVWSSPANSPSPMPLSDGNSHPATGNFTHELNRASQHQQDGTQSDESKPSDGKRKPQRRNPGSTAPRPTTADGGVRVSEMQVQQAAQAAGLKQLTANQAAGVGPDDGLSLDGEGAGEAQAASSARCASTAGPGGSDDGGTGPQNLDSDPGLISSSASESGETLNGACASAEPFQGDGAGQPQLEAAGPHSSPDGSLPPAVAGGARSVSSQPSDGTTFAREVSPFVQLMGQERFARAAGASLDLAALPEQIAASRSSTAQGSTENGVRQNQPTAYQEPGASGEAASAPSPSVSGSRISPASSDNRPSGNAHSGDQGPAPDPTQSSQGRGNGTPDLSSSPKTFAVPAPSDTRSSEEGPTTPTPGPAPMADPAGSYALDAWGGLAARAGRIISSAILSGGTDQAEMRVEIRTEALGAVQLKAFLEGDRMGAVIGVQTPAAHSWLVTELPALHQALSNQNLHLENVSILDRGAGDGSRNGNNGGRSGFGSPPDEPPRSSGEQTQSGSQPVNGTHASAEIEAWPARKLSGRLSVRA